MMRGVGIFCAWATFAFANLQPVRAELPTAVLNVVYPAGIQAGTSTSVAIEGIALEGVTDLRSTAPGFVAVKDVDAKPPGNKFTITVPATTPPGIYDLRAVTQHGLSSPRSFLVSRLVERLEGEANDTAETPNGASQNIIPLNSVVSGKIEKAGDVDWYRFNAKAGDRVVVECWAERIDSQLRPVIEIYDARGTRLQVNRGLNGGDALVDMRIPADGLYDVRLYDLVFSGGNTHFYRLDFDTEPRPEFALPCVMRRGETKHVTVLGRNLSSPSKSAVTASSTSLSTTMPTALDTVAVSIVAPSEPDSFVALQQMPAQFAVDSFAYHHPAGHAPLAIGWTDVPVVENLAGHDKKNLALDLAAPCEVSAQLAAAVGRHWYAVTAKRGEVFWFEAFGRRIGSPLDLDLTIFAPDGEHEIASFHDELTDLGGYRFSTSHVDPVGRFVAPADGRYLILIRNLIGGSFDDPRRIYRLGVRREEPDFALAVVSHRIDQPAGCNIMRGGREWLEVVALRRRGATGPIRVSVDGLPPGVECAEAWIGPQQDRAPLVFTASSESPTFAGAIQVVGHYEQDGVSIVRPARAGTMIAPNRPLPSGRLAQEIPLTVAGDIPFTLVAAPKSVAIDQEGVLDVNISLESRGERPTAPVRLTAVGLPQGVFAEPIVLASENAQGWMSFVFPASVPTGKYTFAISAEVEAAIALNPKAKPTKSTLTLVSNPITVLVKPARVVLSLDPSSPTKIGRGKIVQLKFTAKRVNGFIGKVHVDLDAPGGVTGVRGRGVTLIGQQETGSLQVIATDNAPLGKQSLLRLDGLGTLEDQPIYRAGKPIELEIVE
ncbi:MAG: PPC domain-containing protein [Planctomycetia bacterium]|nr:PPC domain-containing protein [Planctomycetia bacterium]